MGPDFVVTAEANCYAAFHLFSIAEYRCFWRLFLDWSGVTWSGDQGCATL
jgi:hypothetical protein